MRDSDELNENLLRHYVSVLRRRARWVVLGLVVGLAAGVGSIFMVTQHKVSTHYFKATTTLVMGGSGGISDGDGGTANLLPQAQAVAQSTELRDKVAAQLHMTNVQVLQQLSAQASTNLSIPALDITGIATSQKASLELADVGSRTIIELTESGASSQTDVQRKQLQAQIQQLTEKRSGLDAQIAAKPANVDALRVQRDAVAKDLGNATDQLAAMPAPNSKTSLRTLQSAVPIEINGHGYAWRINQNLNARSSIQNANSTNGSPGFSETDLSQSVPISKKTRVVLGAAAGLVLGLISAFVIEAWDDRLRQRDRVEQLTGLPVLAEIPHLSRDQARNHHLAVVDDISGPSAERVRAARTSIQFAMESRGRDQDDLSPVLMVTSPGPGEGKTTVTANLAASFADGGQSVLVIDADFRRPTMRRYLAPVPNLINPDAPADTRMPNLSFLAGPHHVASPDDAVSTLREMVAAWRPHFDLVLLDTPPILTTNDAADLLDVADAVVLVLRSGQTRTGVARRVVSLLSRFRADVLGVVLNGCDRREMDPYYGYSDGYHGKIASSGPGARADTPGKDVKPSSSESHAADREASLGGSRNT